VLLSLILMATTVFPKINVTEFALIGAAAMAVGLAAWGAWMLRSSRAAPRGDGDRTAAVDPEGQWTMPQLTFLEPAGMVDRRQGGDAVPARLPVVSVALLVVKAVQLGGG